MNSFLKQYHCIKILFAALMIILAASAGRAETANADGTLLPNVNTPSSMAAVTSADQTASSGEVVVSATPAPTPHDDWRAKLDHIMSEVSGTQITVTKKATVIKLDQQPPVEKNDLQTEFVKAPGFLITEQHTPGQFNFSYRGLGNPQESEYVTVLMDRVPLMSDWIGFPTLYYVPLPQTVSEIQFIRGGSSLLYGPEPAPAVNFVTKHPTLGTPWTAYLEQVGGSDGYYSTYGSVEEANGPVEMRLAGGFVHADGQRENSDYILWQTQGYLGWRLDEHQVLGMDVHASRFDGGDPGRLTYRQFLNDPDQSTTPYNHNWVDRYSVVPFYELEFGDGWLLQAKGWFTHQEIDSRSAANINPNTGAFPTNTTMQDEDFNNEGFDIRARKNWGDDTMFKGSTLTFGGTIYHGDAPFTRYRLTALNFGPNFLYAPRDATSDTQTLDQDRTSDYQAFFAENIFRLGKFHIVPSFRLDHENVDVDTAIGPTLGDRSADRTIPLWGIGLGNDFGHLNETYFSASSGWRPVRYFDVASPFVPLGPHNNPDPFKSLDFELGVHGTPYKGFWYDVGGFWMEFENRTETQFFSPIDFRVVNSGSSRHRGFEGELSYDFLAPFQHPPIVETEPSPKDGKDLKQTIVPGATEKFRPWQLIAFSNAQFLDAEFTESETLVPGTNHTLVGNEPAFAPDVLIKGGLSFRREKCIDITLTAVYVSEQFWADNNLPGVGADGSVVPAKLPAYKVFNLSGEYYVTKNVRVFGGISNLFDEKYYSRVFFNGSIEPAPHRSGFGGISVEF
jgi:Fe(3+) dicitrate transport protein